MRRPLPLLLALLLVAITFLPTARADEEASKSEQAKKLADRGLAAYDSDDYAGAISYFEQAHAISPAPGLLYNIAQAYRLMGDSGCVAALEFYRRYRSAMRASGEATKESLRARIIEMEECSRKDEDVESEAVARESEAVARQPAASESASDSESASESESESLSELEEEPAYLPDGPAGKGTSNQGGWIVLGIGATSLAISSVTGLLAIERESELSEICGSNVCGSELRSRVKSYDRLRYTSYATGAIGIAALAGGAWLLLRPSSQESTDAGPRRVSTIVTPWVGQRSAGVQWQF